MGRREKPRGDKHGVIVHRIAPEKMSDRQIEDELEAFSRRIGAADLPSAGYLEWIDGVVEERDRRREAVSTSAATGWALGGGTSPGGLGGGASSHPPGGGGGSGYPPSVGKTVIWPPMPFDEVDDQLQDLEWARFFEINSAYPPDMTTSQLHAELAYLWNADVLLSCHGRPPDESRVDDIRDRIAELEFEVNSRYPLSQPEAKPE